MRFSPKILLATLAAILIGAGCDRGAQSTGASGGADSQNGFIVISGDTSGWITPCGCTSNQSGGLLRRGTFLKQLSTRGQVIYADVGGAVIGNSDYQRAKLAAILRGEITMGIAAHNIGAAEASMGPEALRDFATHGNAPLISANATDQSGAPIAPASKIVTLGTKRVAFVGLLSTRYATDAIHISDPQRALAAATGQIAHQYDRLIVLAYMPDVELETFATNAPEADAVIGGPTGQAISPKQIGPTLLAAATNKGKFLIQLDLAGEAMRGSVAELNASFADDPAQTENLHHFLADLKEKNFNVEQAGLVAASPPGAPASYRIAGSASCARCHTASDHAWAASHHANALNDLRAKGFDVDPACQQCHTTGYGLPGGFISLTASATTMAGVGCENCHGPSAAHVADPKNKTPFLAADQCVRCHDHENSPTFDYKVYWPRIKHGRDAPATQPVAMLSNMVKPAGGIP